MEPNNQMTNGMMKPTVEWMAENYVKLNQELFDGMLGHCDFGIFTSGRGSQGGYFGVFRCCGANMKLERGSRRLYKALGMFGKEYLNRDNFAELYKPKIELNGNYVGTEGAWLNVLLHEMCHYATDMDGICYPSHGVRFMNIARYVTSKSNGRFHVDKVRVAEDKGNFVLDSAIQQRNERRTNTRLTGISAIFTFRDNGEARLTLSKSQPLISHIINISKSRLKSGNIRDLFISSDINLINEIVQCGYKSLCRTSYSYWTVNHRPFANLDYLRKFKHDLWLSNDGNVSESRIYESEWNLHFSHDGNHDLSPYGSDNKYNMYGRETGHFGSGTYFSTYKGSSEKRKYIDDARNFDPHFIKVADKVYRVDFDLYKNLYRVRSKRQGDVLYTLLRNVNSLFNRINTGVIFHDKFNPKNAHYDNSRQYQIIRANANALNLKCPSYLELIRMAQNHTGIQSFSTVFMEYNGYNGVNVSGVEYYDNTKHGSVIYDLSKVNTDMEEVSPNS